VSPHATSAAAPGTQARRLQDEFAAHPVPLSEFAAEHRLDLNRARALLRAQRPRNEVLSTMPLLTLACTATGWTRHRTSHDLSTTLTAVHRNLWRAADTLHARGIPAAVHHAYTTGALPHPQPDDTPPPTLTPDEHKLLLHLAFGTISGSAHNSAVHVLCGVLDARTDAHAITRAWATGLLP
jgi:hypothetical protein